MIRCEHELRTLHAAVDEPDKHDAGALFCCTVVELARKHATD